MAAKGHEHHIVPFRVFLSVLILLLVLTVITVAAARVDFGAANAYIAMLIASIKAGFVLLFFMHLKYDDRAYPVIFFTGIFFLMLMYGISELDIVTRIMQIDTVR